MLYIGHSAFTQTPSFERLFPPKQMFSQFPFSPFSARVAGLAPPLPLSPPGEPSMGTPELPALKAEATTSRPAWRQRAGEFP